MSSAITMAAAMQAAQAGISSSAEYAESDAPGWGQRAYDAVIANPHLRNLRGFTMEEARQWLYWGGLDVPAEERAFGGVTQRLLRNRIIEQVGYARAASSHGSPKATYKIIHTHGESE